MAKVEIIRSLAKEIQKKFKGESHKIISLLKGLEQNPKKGKLLGNVGGIVIKELKYKSFRFYFITDGYKLKLFDAQSLTEILIRFVRMSDKKDQQKVINEIRDVLKKVTKQEGFEWLIKNVFFSKIVNYLYLGLFGGLWKRRKKLLGTKKQLDIQFSLEFLLYFVLQEEVTFITDSGVCFFQSYII